QLEEGPVALVGNAVRTQSTHQDALGVCLIRRGEREDDGLMWSLRPGAQRKERRAEAEIVDREDAPFPGHLTERPATRPRFGGEVDCARRRLLRRGGVEAHTGREAGARAGRVEQ